MDAPGAIPADESAVQSAPNDTTSVRSRSPTDTTEGTEDRSQKHNDHNSSGSDDDEEVEETEDEEEVDEEDEEPRLKYAYLTKHLGSVYRNGDATSSFLVAGDKMVCPIAERSYALG
jgi:hypothetical protein